MVDNLSSPPRTRPGGRSDCGSSCSPDDRPEYNFPSSSQYMISTPLTIRGAPMDIAPPPLPPPRHPPVAPSTEQLWSPNGKPTLSSLSLAPGSSLMGGWNRPDKRLSVPRRANIQIPNSPLRKSERVIKQEADAEPFPSLTAKFEEPRPLESQSQRNATNAYDKHQLSKLGRPKTPTRSSTIGSMESSPIANHRLRLDTQTFHKLTLADRSIGSQSLDSPLRTSSPFGRWTGQTHSGAFSPSIMSAATSSHSLAELRSPTYEPSTAPSSLATDNNVFSRVGSIDQSSNASLSLLSCAFEDSDRDSKRLGHVTRDRCADPGAGRFGQSDRDLPDFAVQYGNARTLGGETREHVQLRHSHLDSHMADAPITPQKGLKRKASPNDVPADEPVAQTVRSHTPGRSTKRTSPPAHQSNPLQTSFGSFSSTSPRHALYASTTMPVAPRSVVGMDSQERSSPGELASGTAESVESHHSQSPYGRPTSLETGIRASPGHVTLPPLSVHVQTNAGPHQDITANRSGSEIAPVKPLLANIHLCDCCPKKPKKFSTIEALRAHQTEKQYQCNYCHNRFKNKNEAERHQNSLHLRKQSWSCAALENHYERAFHACNVGPFGASASTAEYDVCGYCGKQFINFPSPDWMDRGKHLTEIHKFGECNQSKKFFRADHFRQHLKHSHEGVPGKWTNMLESACLRDEPPPEPIDHQAQEKLRHQQQYNQIQASQALQAVQQQSATQSLSGPYSVEAARPRPDNMPVADSMVSSAQPRRSYSAFPSQTDEPGHLTSTNLRPS